MAGDIGGGSRCSAAASVRQPSHADLTICQEAHVHRVPADLADRCRVAGGGRAVHAGGGARAALGQSAAFGCTLGIVPHMAAAILGLAALLHTSAMAFQALKYLGVAYLLWMAWSTLREHGALRVEQDVAPKAAERVIVEAVLLNLLNPKLSIFSWPSCRSS